MGALTGSTISSSYDMLLKTATTGGVTGTLKVIEDGLGIDSALQLSTTAVSVTGSLGVVGGNVTINEGNYLMGDGYGSWGSGRIIGTGVNMTQIFGEEGIKLVPDAAASGGKVTVFDDEGNVGIGTAAPSEQLHIADGNLRIGGDSRKITFSGNQAEIGTSGDAPVIVTTNGSEAMRISSDGTVGIGGTPSDKLSVIEAGQSRSYTSVAGTLLTVEDANPNITILGSETSESSRILFAAPSNQNEGTIGYSNNSDYMWFETDDEERMRIDSTGVGIGGAAKTQLDVIVSAVTGYSSVQNDGIVIERGGGTAALNIATDNDQQGAIWFADGDDADSGQIIYDHDSNSLRLGTAATERMRIDSTGVGIGGTPSSSGQLDVSSSNTDTTLTNMAGAGISLRNTSSTDDNYSFIRFDAANGNVASGIFGITTNQTSAYGGLSFATAGSGGFAERMRIDSSGNVIIANMPTSDPAIAGALWSDSGTVKISAG